MKRHSSRNLSDPNNPACRGEHLMIVMECRWAMLALLLFLNAAAFADDACDHLSAAKIPNTTITLVQQVAAGEFNAPRDPLSGGDLTPLYRSLPAFCRVMAEARPTPDSDIKLEVWLPASGWNGKLQGLGNGGFAGLIDSRGLAMALKAGYAATATDAGHTGSPIGAAWAVGHPEKVNDFGHRGIHEMTRVAKAVAETYYGKAPPRSY